MTITINGQRHEVATDASLAEAMRVFGAPERGVAVAVDGAVVPRARWADTVLHEEATVEVLTAVQGG
ncbi:sulfur carrier protein ThiS [Actinopolyspora mortivallis]|uniref:Thiamine biosynthesis protein ThiS n=1 Tax=Actinopolyspora mortivallis TaxID=33906 RepID=A0A2T0GWV3_ACTMO|nr:sulfur carrier protein ThiS [Actinopolyspora mortivallis]PRW63574.1 thiamine biosynthesis protein ThiS [Actinopolyspora mortivallis]